MLEYERSDICEGLMLIKQICQKSVIFVTISISKILVLNMRSIFTIVVTI